MNTVLEYKLKNIPKQPGCYLWKDKYGKIIYVGKAKNLFNRTHQYFNGAKDNKTTHLVENIYDLEFIVVKNENESLILENNLIKKYQPKYNILLKDGSSYPYIVVTNEPHPRIVYTRDLKKWKGKYYGPFASSNSNKYGIYNLILKLFPLRKCNYVKKSKCIYYDINQCLGPCINKVSKEEYKKIKSDINDFFNGNVSKIVDQLKKEEKELSDNLLFEEAQKKLDLINGIKEIQKQQNIVFKSKDDFDVVGFYQQDKYICIMIFSYVNGKLLAKNQQIAELNNSNIDEVLSNYLMQYYFNNQAKPKYCYVNIKSSELKSLTKTTAIQFSTPTRGRYKTISLEAVKNAKEFFKSNYLIYQNKINRTQKSFETLKQLLSLDNLSLIHVYDIANLFADDQVGAMIALENGNFNKNLYRKFIIKNLDASSDYERMKEVVYRQYKRMLDEGQTLPNLIIVDGGIIQINAAIESLSKLHLDKVINVIGLSKDKHHKTNSIVFPNKQTIKLDKSSDIYMYLLNIQEEVHNFAINFFRTKNINSKFKSKLSEIEGLGEKSIKKLMEHYENFANLKKASVNELSQFVPNKIAKRIKEALNE